MSTPGPFEGGNPFEGMPIFGDLAKMFASQGPVNWQIARQFAAWTASQGQAGANVDPLERMAFEGLLRVAELHVSDVTGLSTAATGRMLTVRTVTRSEWATRALDDWKPLFEGMASSLGQPSVTGPGDDAANELLGGFTQLLGPLLLGMQSGSMAGQLAQRALGQYDLPIPRPGSNELVLVPANATALAEEWRVPLDDVRLWVLLSELTHHAVLGRPHVRARLTELLTDYVALFQPDPSALEDKLGTIDPTDPTSFQRVLGDDPALLLGALRSPAQGLLLHQIDALVSVIEGYVDHVLDTIAGRLMGTHGRLGESLRRRRLERGESDPIVEALFGLRLGSEQFDRGSTFVHGVIERAGTAGLARLWRSEKELPTPAEVDAPGLWLARIDLPDEDFDVPDSPEGH